MANQNPNTWEQLYTAIRNEAQTNDDARIAVERLHDTAQTGDSNTFQTKVRELLQEYGERYGFSPAVDGENMLRESLAWRDINFPLEQSKQPQRETAAPIEPGFTGFLPKKRDSNGGGGGGGEESAADKAKKILYESQKKATLEAFERLLDQYKDSPDKLPDAIDNFYRMHLSAAGVLGKQYEILLARAKELYGEKKEFEQHEDVLKNEASADLEKLHAIHQIGPLQDPRDQKQRELELEHLKELREHGRQGNRNALMRSASNIFDEQWEERQRGAILDRFAQELAGMDFSYEDVTQGITSALFTTTVQTSIQEEEPQLIPQQAPGGGRAGGGLGRKVAHEVKNMASSGEKMVVKEAENAAIRAVVAGGEEEAAVVLAGTAEIWGPVGIGCLVIFVVVLVLAIIIGAVSVLFPNLFGSGTQVSPGVSTIVAQNAKIISDNLCKTFIVPGSTVSQRCNGNRGNLYDNINPGAAYPQPHAVFPIFDSSLQNSHFGIQFTKPDKKTYWAYNRPYCTGNCFPWDYRGWGRYWCTDLVIDSYAASGFTAIVNWTDHDQGFTHNWDTGNTTVMMKFFAKNPGYSFIPAIQFDANKISSGSAIFFKWSNDPNALGEHTGIVASIQQDLHHPGFGVINTLEANSWNLTGHYAYRNNYPGNQIVGFGIKTGK